MASDDGLVKRQGHGEDLRKEKRKKVTVGAEAGLRIYRPPFAGFAPSEGEAEGEIGFRR